MKTWAALSIAGILGIAACSGHSGAPVALPAGVALRGLDGGSTYFSTISPKSTWMDHHILLGAWDEQPTSSADVAYDRMLGNNIYWNLAGKLAVEGCKAFCRVDYDTIRAGGMHAIAPEVTAQSGSETVGYQGIDEADLAYGAGAAAWNHSTAQHSTKSCIPSGSSCGYTVASSFYTAPPPADGTSADRSALPVNQGDGLGVLFWETDNQASRFMMYTDILSADSYWMTDKQLRAPSLGACALLPAGSPECHHDDGHGTGLSDQQSALPANYAYDVTRLEHLATLDGAPKPVIADIETGCPGTDGTCADPSVTASAAWHALIAGARGILWFQHNFSGPCIDFRALYDGSDPRSKLYECQQLPGITLHKVAENVSAVNHEIAGLNHVLLSPFAEGYVNAGNSDVSVMAKYAAGTFYIFSAAGQPANPPANDQRVIFHLAGGYTGPVTVIDEGRTLHSLNGAFTDTFENADTVHIYKIGV